MEDTKNSAYEQFSCYLEYMDMPESVANTIYKAYKIAEQYPESSKIFQEYKNYSNIFNRPKEQLSDGDCEELMRTYQSDLLGCERSSISEELLSEFLGNEELKTKAYEYFTENYKEKLDNMFETVLQNDDELVVYRGDQRFAMLDSKKAITDADNDLFAELSEPECVQNYLKQINTEGEWSSVNMG